MGTRWVRRLAGVAFGTTLAGAPVLSPAQAATPPPSAGPTVELGAATLTAGGAALTLQVTVSCPKSTTPPSPGAFSGVSIDVTQALGPEATTAGAGGTPISCDGASHALPIDVTVFAPMAPFKAGVAFVRVDVFADCTPEACSQATDSGEITVTPGKA